MTANDRHRSRAARVRAKRPKTDDNVGYGRPPRAHRFKPGHSGNPKGRPRGAKNEATILQELLNRRIPVREGGRVRRITVLEAILLRFTEDSLKGNTKSAAFLLNRHGSAASREPTNEPDHDDEQILRAFAARLIESERNKGRRHEP